jgi:hypothetical protein
MRDHERLQYNTPVPQQEFDGAAAVGLGNAPSAWVGLMPAEFLSQ